MPTAQLAHQPEVPSGHPAAMRTAPHRRYPVVRPGTSPASHVRDNPEAVIPGQILALPAEITNRVEPLLPDSGRSHHRHAAGSYTISGSGPCSGLDLSAPMFAPCLLGCPGTGRQDAALTSLRLAGLRYSSACHSTSVTQVFKKASLSSGLLIPWFGLYVRYDIPVPTWDFVIFRSLSDSRFVPCLLRACSRVFGPVLRGCQIRPDWPRPVGPTGLDLYNGFRELTLVPYSDVVTLSDA
jgi:hypothetical protein